MNYKKLLCGVGTLTICFMLTGCCMSHEWKEATCTEPKTCTKCGKTEDEALGHIWIDATCAEPKHCSVCGEIEGETLEHTWDDATCAKPKHCSVCGETEGEALEHTLTEANFQQGATCEVCGETVSEPLQAYFEKNNMSCDAELDKTYSSVALCYNDPAYTTTLKATFSDYETFTSDETHEALEDYEWKTVTITLVADDDNAWNYGCSIHLSIEDYYYGDIDYEFGENYTVNYNGKDYEECLCEYEEDGGWVEQVLTQKYIFTIRVPQGYDGYVVGISSDATKTDEDGNPNYDTYFRLK